jgi:hypothetical protein
MTVLEKRPSAALVVAMIALFVALGGTAGAVVTAAVPLAKRALVADNAKKLGGQTAPQIAAQGAKAAVALSPPGAREASPAVGLLSTKTQSAQLGAGAGAAQAFQIVCDTGQKVLSGGFAADNAVVIAVGNRPVSDTTWGIGLLNPRLLGTGEREPVRHRAPARRYRPNSLPYACSYTRLTRSTSSTYACVSGNSIPLPLRSHSSTFVGPAWYAASAFATSPS